MLKHLQPLIGATDNADLGAARAEVDASSQQTVAHSSPTPTAGRPPVPAPEGLGTTTAAATPETSLGLPDGSELQGDTPQDVGFDPYNTGDFDRGRSWEKISKNRAR